MAIIDTLRPTATVSSLDWTTVPVTGATFHGVTSDDSDATYAFGQFDDSPLVLSVGTHGVAADHRRHLGRVRVRGRDGDLVASVRLPSGDSAASSAFNLGAVTESVNGSWGTGLPSTAAGTFGVTMDVQSVDAEVMELYVDIDSREKPSFTPQVLDDGTPTTTVTTTNTPTVAFTSIDLDDLPPREWRAWITQGSTIVWDSGVQGGAAGEVTTSPLVNGSYTLNTQLWSTVGSNESFPSDVETLAFTVNVVPVTVPCGLTATERANEPLFDVEVCVPNSLADYDGDVYAEIQRTDCDGSWTTVALTGPVTVSGTAEYVDWTAPRTLPDPGCDPQTVCEFEYRVRFVGTVDGQLVTSDWVYETEVFGQVDYAFTTNLEPTLEVGSNALLVTGGAGNYASTPDHASLDVTGDLDLRALIAPSDWTPAANQRLVAKYVTAGSQQSYLFSLLTSGALSLTWTANGFTLLTETSSANLASLASGVSRWVRATLDVDNGASDAEVRFYTSTDGVAWTQLGTTQLVGATTSIFAGTAPLEVGSRNNGADGDFAGRIARAQVRSGIDGTLVADPNFADQAAGTTSFVDGAGRTWTLHGTALIGPSVQGTAIAGTGLSPSRLSMGYTTDPELVVGSVPATSPSAGVYLAFTVSGITTGFGDVQLRRLRFKAARSTLDDDFNRSATDSWAGGNFTWNLSGGVVPDNYDVNGTKGLQFNTTAGVVRFSYADAGADDVEVYTVVNFSQGTLTGAGATVFVLGRMTDTANWYAARLGYAVTTGTVTLQLAETVGGAGSIVGASSHVVGTFANLAATQLGVRFLVEGSTLRARAWDTSGAEPTTWQVTETDTSLTTGRFAGVAGRRDSGNTNTDLAIAYDVFRAEPADTELRSLHVRTSADSFAADVYATNVTTNRTEWTQYDVGLNVPFQDSLTIHFHPAVATTGTGQHVSLDLDDVEVYLGEPVEHSLEWPSQDILLRTLDSTGPLWRAACGTAVWDVDRPFTAQLGVNGAQEVTSGAVGGHDLTLNLAVNGQEDVEELERIFERQLVLVSPADSAEQWSAPVDVSVAVLKVARVRALVVKLIGTGPEPEPEAGEVLG